MKEESTYPTYL